jgi:hypothetical protein
MNPKLERGELRHLARIAEPHLAGAGVRISTVDDDALGVPTRDSLPANDHRRSDDLALREYRVGHTWSVRNDNRNVVSRRPLFDTGCDCARLKTAGGGYAARLRVARRYSSHG